MLLSTSAIHLDRDGCVLISHVLVDVTLVHGVSATSIQCGTQCLDGFFSVDLVVCRLCSQTDLP